MRFESVLITGASSGLGRAIALEHARRGAFVYALSRRADAMDSLVTELAEIGPGGHSIPTDVQDLDALRAALEEADAHAVKRASGLDLVIANAGIAENGLPGADASQAARDVLFVNAIAAACTLEAGRALMRPRGRGHLCGISSLAGTRGIPGAPAYCASKAALSTYIESLRADLDREGLTISDVQPGFVRTPMTDRNRFKMPFLMEVDVAARRTVDALEKRRETIRYPRRLAWPLRAAAAVTPGPLWRRVLREK